MKVLGYAASNSNTSINAEIIRYILSKLKSKSEFIRITDYELPIYSIDLEENDGIPQNAYEFIKKISEYDTIIISHAEHNGNFSVFYKNLLDWCSRIRLDFFQRKQLILLSTSPGSGGGKNVLSLANTSAKIFSGEVVFSMSIPNFYDNFSDEKALNLQLEEHFKDKGFELRYIESVIKAQAYEKILSNSDISSRLKHTQVKLFKALLPDDRFKLDDTKLSNYTLSLDYNNVEKVSENILLEKLNCHHGSIIEHIIENKLYENLF